MTRRIIVLVILCAGASGGRTARANYILDQQTVSGAFQGTFVVSAGQDMAQTFTVGATGELGIVKLFLANVQNPTLPLLFDVRPTVGGVPVTNDAAALVSLSVSAADIGIGSAVRTFDFTSTPVPVTAGEQLAIVLRSATPDGNSYGWGIEGTYAPGTLYARHPSPGTWNVAANASEQALLFQTFVQTDSAAVPEPSSILLLGIGAVGAFGLSARRSLSQRPRGASAAA